jgi:riboflavin synthase
VDVIPTTLRETNLGLLAIGDRVNLESDVLGKYARRRVVDTDEPEPCGGLTFEKLAENGFL